MVVRSRFILVPKLSDCVKSHFSLVGAPPRRGVSNSISQSKDCGYRPIKSFDTVCLFGNVGVAKQSFVTRCELN